MTLKTIGKGAPARLHTKEEATAELLHSGVVVSALIDRTAATDMTMIVLDANPFAMLFGGRTGDIRKYAEITGGPVLDTSKKEIAARLAALVDQIRLRYTLGYRPSTPKPQGTFCQLHLQLNPSTLKARADLHKVQVRTRQGYYR